MESDLKIIVASTYKCVFVYPSRPGMHFDLSSPHSTVISKRTQVWCVMPSPPSSLWEKILNHLVCECGERGLCDSIIFQWEYLVCAL